MRVGGAADVRSCGPYRILAPLGRGGGGEVYRAWDPRLHREVALKILRHDHAADPGRVRRFIAEARAASALNHPNIVSIFDADVDGDTPYIVSELIDGSPLREEMRRGAVPLRRLLDLAAQIADGLAAAHEAGIVHRDLKPENIVISRAGRAKIVDFGLARASGFEVRETPLEPSRQLEQTVTALGLGGGTVPYMSPEQACGGATDFRSDQFSFGLILFEMATGRAPFRRDTPAETLHAIINDDVPPLTSARVRLPLSLRWLIERCLSKEPADRYASTADLRRDLQMLRDRLGEATAVDAAAVPGVAHIRRRGMVAVVLLTAIGSAAVLSLSIAAPPFDASLLQFTPLASEPGYEGFPAFSPVEQTIAYAAERDGVLQVFTRRLSSSAAAPLTSGPYDCKHPFWSPDGKQIFYVSRMREREGLWSIAAAGGEPQPVLENASRAAISPDGRTLAFLRDEERADIVGTAALWISTPAGGVMTRHAIEEAKRRYEPLGHLRFTEAAMWFSPDGRRLGISAVPLSIGRPPEERGWQFWVLPLPEGDPARRLQSLPDAAPRVSSFGWLADSRHVVLGTRSASTHASDLWIADLDRDRAWALTRGPESEYDPTVSPAGQIVFSSGEGDYDLAEIMPGGEPGRPLLATSRSEVDPVWSPAEPGLFAYVTNRRGQDEIWLRHRDGRDTTLITQEDFGDDRTTLLSSPSFSPDGQRIAYQRNGSRPVWPLRIWYSHVAGGPPVELVPAAREAYHGAPSWSSDGQWIVFAEWKDQRWSLVKVRVGSRDELVRLRTDGTPNASPRWSPAGGEWITWETADALLLVAADGTAERRLTDEQLLVHEWSPDGAEIFGIHETDDLRLALVAIDVKTGRMRTRADLGPSPPVNHPIKGLSLARDGRIATSVYRLRGDLWLLAGLRLEPGWTRLWPFRSP